MTSTGVRGQLRRHFLWRFLENDVLSPTTDRREGVALAAASIVTPAMFVAFLLSTKYLFSQSTPGIIALVSLDDKLVFVALSMIGTGLVTTLCWDALGLDDRDRATLGVLPIDGRVLILAKLEAVGLLALSALVAVNLVGALLYPVLHVATLPVGPLGLLRLTAAHVVTTWLAGLLAFFAVVGLREAVRTVSGGWFRTASVVAQLVLVVLFVTSLLLLPLLSHAVGDRVTSRPQMSWLPPVWFLGVYERATGSMELRTTGVVVPRRLAATNQQHAEQYARALSTLLALERRMWNALALAGLFAAALYGLNARRAPAAPRTTRRSPRVRVPRDRTSAALLRDPVLRAGCHFSWQTLFRSPPHRLALAVATAASLALLIALGAGLDWTPGKGETMGQSTLALQTVALGLLTVGCVHAMRLPADMGGAWAVHLAWTNRLRAYESGVRLGALAGVLLPLVLALAPLHVWLMGPARASAHAIFGVLLGAVLLEAARLRSAGPSFVVDYEPAGDLKRWAPAYVLAFIVAVLAVTAVERAALASPATAAVVFTLGLVLLLGLRLLNQHRASSRAPAFTVETAAEEGWLR